MWRVTCDEFLAAPNSPLFSAPLALFVVFPSFFFLSPHAPSHSSLGITTRHLRLPLLRTGSDPWRARFSPTRPHRRRSSPGISLNHRPDGTMGLVSSQSASKPSCSAGMARSSTRSRRCLKTARGNACRRTSGMRRRAVKSLLDLFAQSRRFRRMRRVRQPSGEFR